MVFRGRLSKACQRCRERRLRCDFQRPSCSSCIRASVPCVGYRDTVTIRIADETDDVRSKAGARSVATPVQQLTYLAPNIEASARETFFNNYVGEFNETWDIMIKYHSAVGVPEHLSLSLDAVSLRYLATVSLSKEALELSGKKYVSALRFINSELQHAESAKNASTFEAALLLDLFEKLCKSTADDAVYRHAHVEGALALAKLRGMESFQGQFELKSLIGLSLNATMCSLTTRRKISEPIKMIINYAATSADTTSLNWRVSNALLAVVDLIADIYANVITLEEKATACAKLDNQLETASQEPTPAWSYERLIVPAEHRNGILPKDAPSLYDSYSSLTIMQSWNVLRLLRILLYEECVSHCPPTSYSPNISQPPTFITPTIHQICASAPYITDCSFAAAHHLTAGSPCQQSRLPPPPKAHTTSHRFKAYRLILPLFVAAWSSHCPIPTRSWILDQLNRIAIHFAVSQAGLVRDVLLKEPPTGDAAEVWAARRRDFDRVITWHISDFWALSL